MSDARIAAQFGPQSVAAEVITGVDLSGKRADVTGRSSGIDVERAPPRRGAVHFTRHSFPRAGYDWRAAYAQPKTAKHPFRRRGRQAVRLITLPGTILGAPQRLLTRLWPTDSVCRIDGLG
jgi:hypothetical protein